MGGKCSQKELVQHWTRDRMMLPGEADGVERQFCEHQLLVSPATLQVGWDAMAFLLSGGGRKELGAFKVSQDKA